MTRYQRAKRRLTLISAVAAAVIYGAILLLPAIAGQITAEQPVGAYTAAR